MVLQAFKSVVIELKYPLAFKAVEMIVVSVPDHMLVDSLFIFGVEGLVNQFTAGKEFKRAIDGSAGDIFRVAE